jgi:broad specificity phosphatase PhoE
MPPKQIHLIRHAQSEHNARAREVPDEEVVRLDAAMRDAPLTPLGHAQAHALANEVAGLHQIELIVTTPLTRAIQTMLAAFGDHPAPRVVEPLHREYLDSFCDVGRPPDALSADFPMLRFDHLDDPWWYVAHAGNAPFAREDHSHFETRVEGFRHWLAARPEQTIAVVGHSTFLRRFTGVPFANAQRVVVTM